MRRVENAMCALHNQVLGEMLVGGVDGDVNAHVAEVLVVRELGLLRGVVADRGDVGEVAGEPESWVEVAVGAAEEVGGLLTCARRGLVVAVRWRSGGGSVAVRWRRRTWVGQPRKTRERHWRLWRRRWQRRQAVESLLLIV